MAFNIMNLGVPIPSVQGTFSPRLMTYSTQLSVSDLANVLGHDPRPENWKNLKQELRDIYEYVQRDTSDNRRDSIQVYVDDRFGPKSNDVGGFSAVSVALQDPVEFVPFPGQTNAGNMIFMPSRDVIKLLLDGMARLGVGMELMDRAENGDADAKAIIESFTYPVVFFAPTKEQGRLSAEHMGQLFHDINFKVWPVQKQHAIALDQSDPYIRLTNRLAEAPVIVDNGGMAKRVASLGKRSEIVIQTLLHRFVRGAMEGHAFQEANLTHADNPNLTKENLEQKRSDLTAYLTRFATAMGDKFKDRNSLHLSASGWQAVGVLFNDLYLRGLKLDDAQRNAMIDALGQIDWSRSNPEWQSSGLLVSKTNKKGQTVATFAGGGRSNRAALLDHLRKKIGLDVLLAGAEEAQQQVAAPAQPAAASA